MLPGATPDIWGTVANMWDVYIQHCCPLTAQSCLKVENHYLSYLNTSYGIGGANAIGIYH